MSANAAAEMDTTIKNNATNFLISHVLAAYDLDPDQFMHALEVSGACIAGSAAVQCILGVKHWLCGDIDIFVKDQDDAAILGSFLELLGYPMVWRGLAYSEDYGEQFAAEINSIIIYQRWMPWNGIGPSPGAGTPYAGAERFGADVRVRRAIKIFVGQGDTAALDYVDIDCCATTFRMHAGQPAWDIVGNLRRRRVAACADTTPDRRRKYESYGLDVVDS